MQWVSIYLFSGNAKRVVHVTWQMRAFPFNVSCSWIEGALSKPRCPPVRLFLSAVDERVVEKPWKPCEFISLEQHSLYTLSWREAAHHLQVLLSKAIMPWSAGLLVWVQKPPAVCDWPAGMLWLTIPNGEMDVKSCLSWKICVCDRIREGMLCQMRTVGVQVEPYVSFQRLNNVQSSILH